MRALIRSPGLSRRLSRPEVGVSGPVRPEVDTAAGQQVPVNLRLATQKHAAIHAVGVVFYRLVHDLILQNLDTLARQTFRSEARYCLGELLDKNAGSVTQVAVNEKRFLCATSLETATDAVASGTDSTKPTTSVFRHSVQYLAVHGVSQLYSISLQARSWKPPACQLTAMR